MRLRSSTRTADRSAARTAAPTAASTAAGTVDRIAPDAADPRPMHNTGLTIGALLVDLGAITPADVATILARQKGTSALFGELAVSLGLADRATVDRALAMQYALVPPPADNADVAATFATDHPMADRLREMRAALLGRKPLPGDAPMMVVVADAQPGTGAAMLAADLAASSAHLGYAVLLVDANVSRPRQHRLFQLANRHGVSDMAGWARGSEAIHPTAISRLSLLSAGPAVANASETIERLGLSDRLRRIGRNFDMIVIDATAQDPAEAAAAALGSDGFVLAVRRHVTPVDAVRRTVTAFADRGVDPLGLVMVA